MKRLLFFSVLLFACVSAFSQAPGYYMSTTRMGPFKLGNEPKDIEAIVGTKLNVKPVNPDFWDSDTCLVTFNNASYKLVFSPVTEETTVQNTNPVVKKKLFSVSSGNITYKTISGIGIGSSKAQILLAYDKFDISIWRDYFYRTSHKDKDRIQNITLSDTDTGSIVKFTTDNRVVTQIEVSYQEEGD